MGMAGAEGAAHDATVSTADHDGLVRYSPHEMAVLDVTGARNKVAKLEEHLAGAKQALAEAEAALAALETGGMQ